MKTATHENHDFIFSLIVRVFLSKILVSDCNHNSTNRAPPIQQPKQLQGSNRITKHLPFEN